jgi:hypothetical protein
MAEAMSIAGHQRGFGHRENGGQEDQNEKGKQLHP